MKDQKWKGSITVFLSLVFTVILTLTCTVAEGVRMYAAGVRAKSLSYMAMESEFASYARQVFDEYGILMLYDESGIESGVEKYITLNSFVSERDFSSPVFDTIKLGLNKVSVRKVNYVTDDGGDEYVKQILDFEKYEAVGNVAEELLQIVDNYKNHANNQKQIFEDAEESVSNLEKLDNSEILQVVKDYEKTLDKIKEKEVLWKDFEEEIQIIFSKWEEAGGRTTEKDWKKILKKFKKLEEDFKEVYEDVETGLGISEIYKNKKNEMLKHTGAGDLAETSDYIENNISGLEGIRESLELILEDYISQVITGLIDGTINTREALEKDYVLNIDGQWSEISKGLKNLTQRKVSEEDQKNLGIFESAKSLISAGVLELVLTNDMKISTNSVTGEEFPSEEMEKGKNNLLNSGVNKALFIQYLGNHFGSYVEKKNNSVLQYELEYIFAGGKSEKENLAETVSQLVASRQILNTASLMTDKERLMMCESVAASIAVALGLPFMESLVKAIIIEAWAFAESIVDVRVLLQSGKVPAVKAEGDWHCTLDNLIPTERENIANTSSEQENGLDYNTYLKILIFFNKSQETVYRSMDLIQENIRNKYNRSFQLKKAITSAKVNVEYRMDRVFTAFPLVSDILNSKDAGYEMNIQAEYSYKAD